MRRRETFIATFLVFAAVGTGAWAFAASGKRRLAGPKVPPHGLYLERVFY